MAVSMFASTKGHALALLITSWRVTERLAKVLDNLIVFRIIAKVCKIADLPFYVRLRLAYRSSRDTLWFWTNPTVSSYYIVLFLIT